jgi:aerobic-type carbon monoxide dehydrogenase small subunit (CoxS/CutS family)
MTGLCRCGTYNRIRQAINSAVQKMSNTSARKEGGA